MVIFNWIGAAMAALAFAVFYATDNLLLACAVLFLTDIPCRLKWRERRDSLLAGLLEPTSGGQLFFVPCWAWAILLPIASRYLGADVPPPAP